MGVKKIYVILFFAGAIGLGYFLLPSQKQVAKMHDLAGEDASAEKLLEEVVRNSPDDTAALMRLARIYFKNGKEEKGVASLEKLKALEPDALEPREQLIAYYYGRDELKKVTTEREELAAILEKEKAHSGQTERLVKEYRALMDLYSSQGRAADQLGVLTKLRALLPEDRELAARHVDLLLAIGDKAQLLKVAEAAHEKWPEGEKFSQVALSSALEQKDYSTAEPLLRRAIQKSPDDFALRSNLLVALKAQSRSPEKAQQYLEEAFAAWQQFGNKISIYDILKPALEGRHFTFARKCVDAWIAKEPANEEAWKFLLYEFSPKAEVAPGERLNLYRRALAALPKNATFLTQAAFLAQDSNDWSYAADLWAQLRDLHPEKFDFWRHRLAALAKLKSKEYVKELKSAVQRFTGKADLKKELASLFQKSGRWTEAATLWSNLAESKPKNLVYRRNLLSCLLKTPTGADSAQYQAALLAASRAFPADSDLNLQALYLLINQRKLEPLRVLAMKLNGRKDLPESFLAPLSYAFELLGDFPRAFQFQMKIAGSQPEDSKAVDRLMVIASHEGASLGKAIAFLESRARGGAPSEFLLNHIWQAYTLLGKTRPALETVRKLKALRPDVIRYREALIKFYEDVRDFSAAAAERVALADLLARNELAEKEKTRVVGLYQSALRTYQIRQDAGGQIQCLKALSSLLPADLEIRRVYARTLAQSHRTKELQQALSAAIRDFPESPEFRDLQISSAIIEKDYARAEKYGRDAARRFSARRTTWQYLLAAVRLQPESKARSDKLWRIRFQAAQNTGEKANLKEALVEAAESGHLEEAGQFLEKWVKEKPADLELRSFLLHEYASAAKLSDTEKLPLYEQALAQFPKVDWVRQDTAWLAQVNQKWDRAYLLLDQLRRENPKELSYWDGALLCLAHLKGRDSEYARLLGQALKQFPSKGRFLELAGAYALARKNWDSAIAYARKLLQLVPEKAEYRQLLRSALAGAQRWAELMPFLEKELERQPDDADALGTLAYHYADAKQYDKAIPYFEKLAALQPENRDAVVSLAYLYLDTNQLEPAADRFSRIWRNQKDSIEAGALLAHIYYRLGEEELARSVQKQLLDEAGKAPDKLRALGKRLLALNSIGDAETAYFRLLEVAPADTGALRGMGRIKAWNNSPTESIRYFQQYLALVPDDATIQVALGKLFRLMESEEPARQQFELGLKLLDQGGKAENPAVTRAFALAGLGRIDEASTYFEDLLHKSPKDGYLYGDYAEALLDNGRPDQAEEVLKKAPTSGVFERRNSRLLARVHFDRRQYYRAATILDDLNERYPRDPGILKELGYFSEILERWPDALNYYQEAWADEAELPDGHSETAAQSVTIMKEHNPQVHLSTTFTEGGGDRSRLDRLFLNYPLHDLVEMQGEFFHRDIEGTGLFPSNSKVDDDLYDFHLDAIVRPGFGLKFTAGLLGTLNPSETFFGAKAGIGYRQEDWLTEVVGKWRESWSDPARIVPFAGAQDSVAWQLNWFPKQWFNSYSTLSYGMDYLLEPPAGGSQDAFEYVSWDAGAEIKVIYVPQVWLFYNFSFLEGNQKPFYASVLGLQDGRATHSIGARFEHDFGKRLSLFASTSIGHDARRNLHIDALDLVNYSAGLVWRFSDLLEAHLEYLRGTETTLGNDATFTSATAGVVLRF